MIKGPETATNSMIWGDNSKVDLTWTNQIKVLINHQTAPIAELRSDQTIKNGLLDIIFKLHAKKSPREVITMANRVKELDPKSGKSYQEGLQERLENEQKAQLKKRVEDRVSDERIIFNYKPEIAYKIVETEFAHSSYRYTIAEICRNIMSEVNKMVKMQELRASSSPQPSVKVNNTYL